MSVFLLYNYQLAWLGMHLCFPTLNLPTILSSSRACSSSSPAFPLYKLKVWSQSSKSPYSLSSSLLYTCTRQQTRQVSRYCVLLYFCLSVNDILTNSSSTFALTGLFSEPSVAWPFFFSLELFFSLLLSFVLEPFIRRSSDLISDWRGEWKWTWTK